MESEIDYKTLFELILIELDLDINKFDINNHTKYANSPKDEYGFEHIITIIEDLKEFWG